MDVPDNVSITDINVGVSVTHAFISDLSVTVMSPAGTTVILVLTNECGEANINTVFDDEGADKLYIQQNMASVDNLDNLQNPGKDMTKTDTSGEDNNE